MIAKISGPILMQAFSETAFHRSQIQGFISDKGTRHWVEDCTLPEGQKVRWTQRASSEKYDEIHDLKIKEIERLEMQVVCEWLVENSPATTADI